MIQPVWRLQMLLQLGIEATVGNWHKRFNARLGFDEVLGRLSHWSSQPRWRAFGLLLCLGSLVAGLGILAPAGQAQSWAGGNWAGGNGAGGYGAGGDNRTAVQIWRSASFPVENFQAYTSPFGYRRSATGGDNSEFHYGLDMAAPQGSYIRSWWGGEVVEVTDDTRCGTSLVIESGNWEHIYCHMMGKVEKIGGKRYLVDREGNIQIRLGQTVQTGARIGRVGMTGRTTGPHLHWGLKHRGSWVDPGLVLRAMQSSRPVS